MATLLLIEDSAVQRAQLRDMLAASGAFERIVEAGDGVAGLRALLHEPVDLVLCDLELPGIDGERLMRAKAGQARDAAVPFVFVTSTEDTARKARLLRSGASDVIAKPVEPTDLLARLQLHLRIKALHRRLQEKNAALEALSMTDALTGLRTRRYLADVLEAETTRARRYRLPLSVWMADLDNFKELNDRHGHLFGDRVLRRFGRVVLDTLRATDVAARYGGEEFLMLLPHTPRKGALAAAERVRLAMESGALETESGEKVCATVSIGVATLEPGLDTAEALVEAADRALYRAKREGRNRVTAARGPAGAGS